MNELEIGPARSPAPTPLDFFFRGSLRALVDRNLLEQENS